MNILSLARTVISAILAKGWVFLIGLVIGIPTSILGMQWMGVKLIKQDTDCMSNIAYEIADQRHVSPEEKLNALTSVSTNYIECLNKVDPNKGTVEFLKEQYIRQKSDRP
ncbi:MAG: hypothetical protein H6505_06900 [Calditrichaeota bacterium]|nr:hypothetical protein [Calditrichota bacterium]